MARLAKPGIRYFSHDVDMDNDIKVKYIKAKYGLTGKGLYVTLLESIYYEKGYYLEINDRFSVIFCSENKIDISLYNEILKDCLEEGLFDKSIYDEYNILTSKRIQENYIKGCEKKIGIEFIQEYLLTDPDTVKKASSKLKVTIISKKGALIPKKLPSVHKLKETKLNKNKEEERKVFSELLVRWNVFAELNKLSKIIKLTDERQRQVLERISEPEFNFEEILNKAKESDWLRNKVPKLNLDFIISNDSNYIKILEGKFNNEHNKPSGNKNTERAFGRDAVRPGQSKQKIKPGNLIVC